MINIIKDVDLIDHVKEYDIVLIGVNIYGSMSGGFQYDVKNLYPYVHKTNIETKYGDENKLGTVIEAKNEGEPTFALCFINKLNTRPDLKKDNLDYKSLEKCLKLCNILYKDKKICSTILGASEFDGNGNKDIILKLFEENLNNCNIDLYDYQQFSKAYKWCHAYHKGQEIKKKNKEEYKKFLEESKKRIK